MMMANVFYRELLDVASDLSCVGVEIRTDLPGLLFGGTSEEAAVT